MINLHSKHDTKYVNWKKDFMAHIF